MRQINSQADLEALRGTADFADAIRNLVGSATIRVNVAVYPDGYGQLGYEGEAVEPIWEEREDLTTIERLGLTLPELLAELEAVGTEGASL